MEKEKSHTSTWVGIVVAMPFLYVLSFGPVAWLLQHQGIKSPPTWFRVFYAPLEWMWNHSELFGRFIEAYMSLWRVR